MSSVYRIEDSLESLKLRLRIRQLHDDGKGWSAKRVPLGETCVSLSPPPCAARGGLASCVQQANVRDPMAREGLGPRRGGGESGAEEGARRRAAEGCFSKDGEVTSPFRT